MTDVYKKISCIFIIVISLFSGLLSAKDTMTHDAFTYRYSDPYLAIDLLEQSNKVSDINTDINNTKQPLAFENYELLIHLYFKTEQHQKAEQVFKQLQPIISHSSLSKPKLALIQAHIILHNQNTESFEKTLAPYLDEYQNNEDLHDRDVILGLSSLRCSSVVDIEKQGRDQDGDQDRYRMV